MTSYKTATHITYTDLWQTVRSQGKQCEGIENQDSMKSLSRPFGTGLESSSRTHDTAPWDCLTF